MKYFIYIVTLLYSISTFSQINITKDVEKGATNIKNGSLRIEASNTIKKNAVAVYKAGETIILENGFFADAGSNVFMTIEDEEENSLSSKNLEDDFFDNKFMAYPNPSNGLFKVQGSEIITAYAINNLIGSQIISKKNLKLNTINIDISAFTSGVYFLELQKENGEIVREKIIKN